MGMNLFDEFADHSPDCLTPRQRWVGGVLAKDANDTTRITFHGVVSDVILRKARVNKREMYKVLAVLQEASVVEKVSAGHTSQTAKYRFLPLDPERVSNLNTQSEEGVESEHPQAEEEGVHSGSERVSNLGQEGVQNGSDWVSSSDTPTPPFSSFSSPSPSADEAPEPQREGGREAAPKQDKQQTPSPEFAALASIIARHPKLAMGEQEIHTLTEMVTPWLERTTIKHLEAALTQGLPQEVSSPIGLVRMRLIAKLPPAAPPRADTSNHAACYICTEFKPVAFQEDGKTYCHTHAKPCRGCGATMPENRLTLDGLCRVCDHTN